MKNTAQYIAYILEDVFVSVPADKVEWNSDITK